MKQQTEKKILETLSVLGVCFIIFIIVLVFISLKYDIYFYEKNKKLSNETYFSISKDLSSMSFYLASDSPSIRIEKNRTGRNEFLVELSSEKCKPVTCPCFKESGCMAYCMECEK